MIQEKKRQGASDYVMLLVLLVAQLGTGYSMFVALRAMNIGVACAQRRPGLSEFFHPSCSLGNASVSDSGMLMPA